MSDTGTEAAVRRGRMLPGMNLHQRVWALTSRIPPGRVATYAQLAHALESRAYRAVGQALQRNPYAPEVPCHRVVGSDGRLTGYQGADGAEALARKARLLAAEGVAVANGRVDLARFGWRGVEATAFHDDSCQLAESRP